MDRDGEGYVDRREYNIQRSVTIGLTHDDEAEQVSALPSAGWNSGHLVV